MTKMSTLSIDPIINSALQVLTSYAGSILKGESELSMQYMCSDVDNTEHSYRVFHKDHPDKSRLVVIDPLTISTASCSCRKQIWHGIVCRHIIRAFRHRNLMSLPIEMFNQRWMGDYVESSLHSAIIDMTFASNLSSMNKGSELSENHRIAELSAISKHAETQYVIGCC